MSLATKWNEVNLFLCSTFFLKKEDVKITEKLLTLNQEKR
jgi:hypothetical protein